MADPELANACVQPVPESTQGAVNPRVLTAHDVMKVLPCVCAPVDRHHTQKTEPIHPSPLKSRSEAANSGLGFL